jgi:hypothetical protein
MTAICSNATLCYLLLLHVNVIESSCLPVHPSLSPLNVSNVAIWRISRYMLKKCQTPGNDSLDVNNHSMVIATEKINYSSFHSDIIVSFFSQIIIITTVISIDRCSNIHIEYYRSFILFLFVIIDNRTAIYLLSSSSVTTMMIVSIGY